MVTKNTMNMLNAKEGPDILTLKKNLDAYREQEYGRPAGIRKKKSFAPSSLGAAGQCSRYWFYAFNGAEYYEKFSPRSAAALENGKDAHERIEGEYQAVYGAELETKITYEDPPIYGFSDVIVELDGVLTLVDVKTVKDDKFSRLEASLKPDPANALQVLIYMYIKNIDYGILHYEAKGTHEELFFKIAMNDRAKEYVERVFSWMRMVRKNALDGELPKRNFDKKAFQCNYCPIKRQCWSDSEGTVQIDPLKIEGK